MAVTPLGRQFNRLWAASALSNLADGVFQVALPLLAIELTDSPALVAGVALTQRLPWLLVALPAGALADRLDRRRTMVNVDAVRVLVMAALAGAVAADVATIPLLYAAGIVLGVGETLFDTAAQSILPAVVPRDDLSRANGRLQAGELLMNQFVGPPLGGVLAASALAAAFAAASGAYLAAAACLLAIAGTFTPARAAPRGTTATSMRADITEGLRFVWNQPILRTLGIMLGVTNLAWTAYWAVFVLYAVDPGPIGLSTTGYGLLLASSAVGGATASFVVVRIERRVGRARALAGAVVVFGSSLAVPAITAGVAANVAAAVAAAFASIVWNVITVSLRQRITPDHLLGRMNAAYRLLGWGTMPIGAALGGAIAQLAGLRPTFAIAALLHVPMLAGFLVVTDERIADAERPSVPVPPPS